MRRPSRSSVRAVHLNLLMIFLCFTIQAGEGPRTELWLTGELGAVRVGEDSALSTVSRQPTRAVAFDEARARVWLLGTDRLTVRELAGSDLWHLDLDLDARAPAAMAVVPGDGALWIAAGSRLINVGAAGQHLDSLELPAPAVAMAMEPEGSTLWVAAGGRLGAYDAISGLSLGESLGQPINDLAFSDGTLWVARADGVFRLRGGQESPFAKVAGALALAPDGRGGLWVAVGPELIHLDSRGDRQSKSRPFGEPDDLEHLVFDPVSHSVWVASGNRLRRLSLEGKALDDLALPTEQRLAKLRLRPVPVADGSTADQDSNDGAASGDGAAIRQRIPANDPPDGNGGADLIDEKIPSLRGFVPNNPFITDGEIDAINTANGNLTLSIPLGQTFTVGPHLSYQFRAIYNSDTFDHASIACLSPANCVSTFSTTQIALPQRSSNAGLGWEIHFGKLFPPDAPSGMAALDQLTWPNRDLTTLDSDAWVYISPHGSSHVLTHLPGRDNDNNGLPLFYSKDSSRLRMKQRNSSTVDVEHPNGTVSRFKRHNGPEGTFGCGGGATGCWRLHKILDGYDNQISFTYPAISGNVEEWKISDSTQREHKIFFWRDSANRAGGDAQTGDKLQLPNGDELGDLKRILNKIRVAAIGESYAEFVFSYSNQEVDRGRPHDPTGNLGQASSTMTVPLLTEISIPLSQPYKFQYFTDFSRSGKVQQVILPARGRFEYDYEPWHFPTQCNYDPSPPNPPTGWFFSRYGIGEKSHHGPDGTQIAKWTYFNDIEPNTNVGNGELFGPGCKRPDYRKTQVDGPTVAGVFIREEFFNAITQGRQSPSANDPISSWQITDAGLPFTKTISQGTEDSDRIFLSQRISQCGLLSCDVMREKYVRYAMEWRTGCSATLLFRDEASCWQVDPVPVRERTIFLQDAGKWKETRREHHDGAGNQETVRFIDDFLGSERVVTHTTDFNVGAATARPESSTTGYITMGSPQTYLPKQNERWLLTTFDAKTQSENGVTYRTDYAFDDKGTVKCIRQRRRATSENARDVVTKYTLGGTAGSNAGMIELEVIAGGENGTLAPGVCNVQGSEGDTKFTFDHGNTSMTRSSTRIGSFPYRFRAVIDRNTGLPTATFNPSGQRTDIAYDVLGRPTQSTPTTSLSEATTTLIYSNEADQPATIEVERKFGTTVFANELLVYDPFGRLQRELRNRPTGQAATTRSERLTTYDPLGRVTAITTMQPEGASVANGATKFSQFDAVGRAKLITRPDGTTEKRFYKGEREMSSEVEIQTSAAATSTVLTTTEFDGLGRRVLVRNPLYALATRYDPKGQIIGLERLSNDTFALVQQRLFELDNREILISESHPEIGSTAGLGKITFKPGPLGNPREVANGFVTLLHEYDGDARLVEVREPSGRVWEEFEWGTANSQGNFSLGKIVQAKRHNYPPPGIDWMFVEDYQYKGRLGKMSNRRIQLQFPNTPIPEEEFGHTFDQSWEYDHVGNVVSTIYPTCVDTPQNDWQYCNDPFDDQPPHHEVERTLNQGLPVEISSELDNDLWAQYKYHPNFQIHRIDYSNLAHTDRTQGAHGMQRPARFKHYGGPAGNTLYFDSGDYQYDGAGNIWSIGVDKYEYDEVSRLVRGTAAVAGRFETYTYDLKDNLTSVARDGGGAAGFNINGKNRLIGNVNRPPDTVYDAAGNVVRVGPAANPIFELSHDAYNMVSTIITQFPQPAEEYHAYGPGNFRWVSFNATTGERFWTLRDRDGKVLREHRVTGWGRYVSPSQPGEHWEFLKDLVHGPQGLIATRDGQGEKHYFHQDHLGSNRLVTDQSGNDVGRWNFYPYGALASGGGHQERAAQFAGHELDRHEATYYMLARSYIPLWMRFANVDPARTGWNLYEYANSNPVNFIDPDGRAAQTPEDEAEVSLALSVMGVGLGIIALEVAAPVIAAAGIVVGVGSVVSGANSSSRADDSASVQNDVQGAPTDVRNIINQKISELQGEIELANGELAVLSAERGDNGKSESANRSILQRDVFRNGGRFIGGESNAQNTAAATERRNEAQQQIDRLRAFEAQFLRNRPPQQ